MSFSIPFKKKFYANFKNTEKKLLTYNLRLIASARHVKELLSTLVDNLSGLNKCKCEEPLFDNIKFTYELIRDEHIVHTRCKACLWLQISPLRLN